MDRTDDRGRIAVTAEANELSCVLARCGLGRSAGRVAFRSCRISNPWLGSCQTTPAPRSHGPSLLRRYFLAEGPRSTSDSNELPGTTPETVPEPGRKLTVSSSGLTVVKSVRGVVNHPSAFSAVDRTFNR